MFLLIFIFLLIILPKPSQECFGYTLETFPENCGKFCDSKRPPGIYDKYNAHCLDAIFPNDTQSSCKGDCKNSNCPDECCPNGDYVECLAIPIPIVPPSLLEHADVESLDPITVIILLACGSILIIGIGMGAILFCGKRCNANQRQGLVYDDDSVSVSAI